MRAIIVFRATNYEAMRKTIKTTIIIEAIALIAKTIETKLEAKVVSKVLRLIMQRSLRHLIQSLYIYKVLLLSSS